VETRARERLRLLGRQWTAAAQDAFAGTAHSPERYLAAGRLVAAWLERLRALPPGPFAGPFADQEPGGQEDRDEGDDAAVAALASAWEARDSGAPAGEEALPLTPAERAALTAAAFAIRYAEVADWLASRQRRRAVAAAADTSGWVVLDEAGDPAGDPFITYRRLEVDPTTGSGVLVETRPDDAFSGVIHEVHLVSMDLQTGELDIDNSAKGWEFNSASEREELVAALRSNSDRMHGNRTG
jgi:hypothetical protein